MKVRIWSTNLHIAVTKLDVFSSKTESTFKATTKKICDQILKDSDTRPPMVPEKTGALRASGRVEPEGRHGHAVKYGDAKAPYALQVHDDLRPRKYTRAGSGPKFVEAHFLRRVEGREAYDTFMEDIEDLIGEAGL